MAEKLFILLLAKPGNYIPEGGIWMNTQRPEWNDANNALAGKGISIVTLVYLRRYISFLSDINKQSTVESAMYRADQNNYMLYPNREVPLFIEKNNISEIDINSSQNNPGKKMW